MLTIGALLALAYLCRRPLFRISNRLIVFSVGFVIGWRIIHNGWDEKGWS